MHRWFFASCHCKIHFKIICLREFFPMKARGVSKTRGLSFFLKECCFRVRVRVRVRVSILKKKKKIDSDPGPCPDYHPRFTDTPSSMWPSCLIYCLHLWRKVQALSTRIRTFWNPQIFLCGFKNSTFTLFRIQIEFARPHASGFTLSSSANL